MWKWPDEVVTWLRENVSGKTTREVTELINKQGFDDKYGMVFTESSIKGAKARYKIQSGTRCGTAKEAPTKLYPEAVRKFIRENYSGIGPKEMAQRLNDEFGTSYTHQQLKAYYAHYKINSGLDGYFPKGHIPASKGKKMSQEQYEKCKATMFKKGNVPHNQMQVGEITHTTEGYLIRKVSNTGTIWQRFKFVHRETWERHNGPIPPGKKVIFLDSDKENCDITNLELVDSDENLELARSRLRFNNPELTKTAINIAKVKIAARKRKRSNKNECNSERT